jgi:hypothetical protein
MTFAHELQHFLQCSAKFDLWAANYLMAVLVPNEHLAGTWQIPFEVEARICAKKVAVEFYGDELVREYISERIANAPSPDYRKDWKFVQAIDLSTDPLARFSLAKETRPLVQRYRSNLQDFQRGLSSQHLSGLDLNAEYWSEASD